jgi:hypothetical protein
MNKILPSIIHHFDCECTSVDHIVRFEVHPYKKDGQPPEMYAQIQLNNYLRWYQRIWPAIRFLFGKPAKDVHWDTWFMRIEDADKLQNVITEYKIYWEKYEASLEKKDDK